MRRLWVGIALILLLHGLSSAMRRLDSIHAFAANEQASFRQSHSHASAQRDSDANAADSDDDDNDHDCANEDLKLADQSPLITHPVFESRRGHTNYRPLSTQIHHEPEIQPPKA